MESFTPGSALLGGALIGLAASAMLGLHGRIAGISGIVGGLLRPRRGEVSWRLWFVAGMLVSGALGSPLGVGALEIQLSRSSWAIVVAGLLVGFGSRLGSGCTSGHGVCGVTRLSTRSLVATATFMLTGIAAAALVTQAFGGTL